MTNFTLTPSHPYSNIHFARPPVPSHIKLRHAFFTCSMCINKTFPAFADEGYTQ